VAEDENDQAASGMTSEQSTRSLEARVAVACRELWPDWPASLVTQCVRVALAIGTGRGSAQALTTADDLARRFRSRGLIPLGLESALVQAWEERTPAVEKPPLTALAMACASCLYPQDAAHMEAARLARRVSRFLEGLLVLVSGELPEIRLDGVSREEWNQICGDLSAADAPGLTPNESDERKTGAALFLATHDSELLERIVTNWRADREAVLFVRSCLYTPPSLIDDPMRGITVDGYASERPDWKVVEHDRLPALFPDATVDAIRTAIHMDQSVRKLIRRVLGDGAPAAEAARTIWGELHGKLLSGFPHYAFTARLMRWWSVCVSRAPIPGAGPAVSAADEGHAVSEGVTSELLYVLREGYRLVRVTFYQLRHGGLDRTEIATENEAVRKTIDQLWRRMLEEGQPEKTMATLSAELKIPRATLYVLAFRLRRRMTAYRMTRFDGAPTHKLPREGARAESATRTIGSLSRVPMSQTLLWAFTAHLFLRPSFDGEHKDPWWWDRYLEELRVWFQPGSGDRLIQRIRDARRDSHSNELAAALMESPVGKELLANLYALGADGLRRWCETADGRTVETQVIAHVRSALGDGALEACSSAFLKRGAPRVKRGQEHGIVPIWLLTCVERFPHGWDTARQRLGLSEPEDEWAELGELYEAMRSKASTPTPNRSVTRSAPPAAGGAQ
jgi:hypothetical protein